MSTKRIKPRMAVTVDADLKQFVMARAAATRRKSSQVVNEMLALAMDVLEGEKGTRPPMLVAEPRASYAGGRVQATIKHHGRK